MKFSVTQEKLSKSLQTVFRAIPTKASLPILTNILLEAKDNTLHLSATNMETAIKTSIGASVEEEGTVAIPAKLFKEFVTSLSETNLSAELKGYTLQIKSDKTKTKFNGMDAQDYPQLPTITNKEEGVEIPTDILERISQVVTFAAASDTAKPAFTGVYIKFGKDSLTAVATDGFRLSELEIKVESGKEGTSVLVPAKTLAEIARIFSNSEEPVKIYFNDKDNLLLFGTENTMVATRILYVQYPDYTKIIPTESIMTANFSTEDFAEAVKLTNIFSKEANNVLRVKFDPVEKHIKVSSPAEISGENESTIPADVEGELLEMAFNSKYLTDFLNNVKVKDIELKTNGVTAPCLITSPDYSYFLHIIMPMQL